MIKVGDKMAFDDELDLSQWFSDDETTGEPAAPSLSHQSHVHPHSIESQYILHAVMIHSGNANFGHYFSYIRPGLGILGGFGSSCKGTEPPPFGVDSWFRFDDARITKATRLEVEQHGYGGQRGSSMSTTAYLLQYVRKDAIPALLFHR
jgi:hypothetical protein